MEEQAAGRGTDYVLCNFAISVQYGRPPENLQELIDKGFMKQMPQDPYGSGTLTYKRNGDDFILYSWGLNFIDDGGKIVWDDNGNVDNYSENSDMVFWPLPKETEEEKQKRLKEQNTLGIGEDE